MRSFHRLSLATLIAVYILILVGGVVRSTGSGMGCPDWPKCFGNWVPPSSVNDLPENYKDIYSAYRDKKNQRFAKYLAAMGLENTASKILNDESILNEADFNPAKTWIEYFNRLTGVIIGMLIVAVAFFSLRFRKTDRPITIIAFLSLALVIFQGWIGSFVVSTNLTPWTVSVHMFLALLLVFLLVYLVQRSHQGKLTFSVPLMKGWVLACMCVLLVQILLGTQVREALDRVASEYARENWIEKAGLNFAIHRSFSWVVFILHAGLVVKLLKTQSSKALPLALIVLILGTIVTGSSMAYFAVPPFLQPVHLLLASMVFGVQAFLLLQPAVKQKTVVVN